MTDAGLTPTQQVPVSAVATVEIGDQPVTDVWQELFDHVDVVDEFTRAVRELARGQTVPDLYDDLEEQDVPYWVRSRIRDIARGDRSEAWRLGADIVPNLGRGHSTVGDLLATARLFANAEAVPTIAFVVTREFEDADRRTRTKVCQLIGALAQGFDVRFVARAVTQGFVRNEHRGELPGVSEWRHTDRDEGPLAARVEQAIGELNPDGRPVAMLRALAAEDSEVLSYSQLYGEFSEVKKARVRQTIGTLEDHGLVAKFGPQSSRKVELRETGTRVLGTLDAEIGRQSRLDDGVKNFGNSYPQCRVNPRTGGEGKDGGQPYTIGWMAPHNHAAATAATRNADVALVDSRLPDGDGRTHEVSYDPDADQAVVAVQASEPLPYVVSSAVALATPWFVDDVLPPSRLEAIDEPPEILREARCIGGLSDEALDDPAVLRDNLVEWGQKIQDLTVDLRNGEYRDRDEFRSLIVRLAHGLAGSIAHLLDTAGIDLVREVRVPKGADLDDLEAMATSIGITAAIQSRYNGVYNSYRQLFEQRTDKRNHSFSATVDADAPVGSLIGSFVFRGEDLHRLREPLEDRLANPHDLHDDAPEFVVPIEIIEPGRPAVAAVANDILLPKRIQPTEIGVTLCHAFVPDLFAAAQALEQLDSEDDPRELRVDELRYAFSTLSAADVLPSLPSTVSAVTHALLTVTQRLSKGDLAERADVSPRSIYEHRDLLEALGLLDVDGGYRLELSFQTTEERQNPVYPDTADAELAIDVADAILETYLEPKRYGDPEDPLGGVLFNFPDDSHRPWALADHDDLAAWFRLGARLAGVDRPTNETVVTMGPTIEQQPLPTADSEVSA